MAYVEVIQDGERLDPSLGGTGYLPPFRASTRAGLLADLSRTDGGRDTLGATVWKVKRTFGRLVGESVAGVRAASSHRKEPDRVCRDRREQGLVVRVGQDRSGQAAAHERGCVVTRQGAFGPNVKRGIKIDGDA